MKIFKVECYDDGQFVESNIVAKRTDAFEKAYDFLMDLPLDYDTRSELCDDLSVDYERGTDDFGVDFWIDVMAVEV